MATIKQKEARGITVITITVVSVIVALFFFIKYKWHLSNDELRFVVPPIAVVVSVPLAVVMAFGLQRRICHENTQLSHLIYRVRQIESGKNVGLDKSNKLKDSLLSFAKTNPDLKGEAYRYLGDLSFAMMQTEESLKYYSKAMDLFSRDSDDYLYVFNRYAGGMLRMGAYTEALKEFEFLSNTKPMYSIGLGVMYEFGWGMKSNLDKALRLYEQAVRDGNDLAVVHCSEVHWRLSHTVRASALDGYETYMFKCHSQEGYKAGVSALTASAEAGYAPSQYELGTLYMQGKLGKKKMAEAFRWLRKGADQNYLPALHNLGFLVQARCMDPEKGDINKPKIPGTLLYSNEVVWNSFFAGMDLIRKAAEAGYAPSQHSMGATCLREGDSASAKQWLKLAADQGYKRAKEDYENAFGSV